MNFETPFSLFLWSYASIIHLPEDQTGSFWYIFHNFYHQGKVRTCDLLTAALIIATLMAGESTRYCIVHQSS
ncbi:MAG: hypothetical protein CVU39_20720 [Chloroflexi bacterium HGW-Chloroflexi-10]|nr:MAG: hypothetical protein CVU39_20720 [Chloroflexi bacterium HGW-Chloroflexi-10]